MSKKIILITSGQPSANPRLVKEAITLTSVGYKVKVIYCPLSPWADAHDEKLFQENPFIEWIKVGYHPVKEKWRYLYARIRQKIYKKTYTIFGNKFDIGIKSMVLFSQEMESESKRHPADLYMGHNLGALPAVVKAAKKNKVSCSFDFEDFHRGEDVEDSAHWVQTKKIEDQYIPYLTFTTAASPLIGKEYQKFYPTLPITVINNCFPLLYKEKPSTLIPKKPLELFWFSQTIGKGRGLEDIISALKNFNSSEVKLTLMGNCTDNTKKYLNEIGKVDNIQKVLIEFCPPVNHSEVFKIASKYDIGLSLEPGRDDNNKIALSNKVFTYLLVGNAIIFSKTPAQEMFFQENFEIGSLYNCGNIEELVSIIKSYLSFPEKLQLQKENAFLKGLKKYNWDLESEKLIALLGNKIKNE